MTAREAKKLSLKIWRYLAKHPECRKKSDIPEKLLKKVADMRYYCPLCELFYRNYADCPCCPIGRCNMGSWYHKWYNADVLSPDPKLARKEAAQKIVEIIKAWKPKEKRNDERR